MPPRSRIETEKAAAERTPRAGWRQYETNYQALIGIIVTGIAHEVNNPLSYMLASLSFMQQELARYSQEPWNGQLGGFCAALDDAQDGIGRVRDIVHNLLSFVRADTDRCERLDVRQVVESAIRVASHQLRCARLVRELSAVPLVEVHAGRLGQVVLRLLANAALAIPPGHPEQNEIRVSTLTDAEGRVVIAIRDTGAGMPPNVVKQLLDPHCTVSQQGLDVGLILSVCHRIVQDLGGEILATSEVGRGSEFRVCLPRAPASTNESPLDVPDDRTK